MWTEFLIILRDAIAVLNILFAAVIVFSERKNPASTWAWLMVVLILPYFGFIIYCLFGLDSHRLRTFFAKTQQDNQLYQTVEQLSGHPSNCKNPLPYLKHVVQQGGCSINNSVSFYFDGDKKMEALFKDIDKAQKHIHIQYYIFRNDELGKMLIDKLAKKAAEGINVRLLIDGMGCVLTSKRLFKPLIESGGQLGIFQPPYFIRINFRNHRKIVVIDGNLAYTGGFNIGKEYLGKGKKYSYWRDCHMRVEGDAAKDLQLRFIMDWNFSQKERLEIEDLYFPKNNFDGNTCLQIVASGPDIKWQSILYAYNKMINSADKYIFIQTPYFVPDGSILEALRIAALSGIDVRIIIPANPDHPFVYWAALSYIGELLEAGVKCYQFTKGFIHSKVVIIDDEIATVGTANMDIRSFKLNFEVNGFLYDKDAALALKKQFLEDLKQCSEIDLQWYRSCSRITRIREAVSRLLSPLL